MKIDLKYSPKQQDLSLLIIIAKEEQRAEKAALDELRTILHRGNQFLLLLPPVRYPLGHSLGEAAVFRGCAE